ncbi:MAG: BlaI/MecI/CopY family transcriptional regulator [Lachnospiraceae bacterium]|nr:BlaI/MecI/CopY family transcriptional regulator [Lachnospiraceae bacterium]
MGEMKLGAVESKFADIIWKNAPLTTRELVDICDKELGWKRTTTYTVLKKLCERGIFQTEDSVVTVKMTKEEFFHNVTKDFVETTYDGSLPAFLVGYAFSKKFTKSEADELRRIIDSFEEKEDE